MFAIDNISFRKKYCFSEKICIAPGSPHPLGVTHRAEGINFAIHAATEALSLSLFQRGSGQESSFSLIKKIDLSSTDHKTGNIWHVFVKNLPQRVGYGYSTAEGGDGLLIDPYARGIISRESWRKEGPYLPIGVVIDPKEVAFDWEDVRSPLIEESELVIYEMHVRGFTQDISSGSSGGGTFRAIMEKIPHLKRVGINAVELMPIHEFDESNYENYWGYQSIHFFSLMSRYATDSKPEKVILEFKTLVKELHRHGIQLLVDVVFNHTGEGNELGPTLSFKGLDREGYFMIKDGHHQNHSGCGNTMNVNHPVTSRMLIDALEYFVEEFHVDGFRFDLAGAFTRDGKGDPIHDHSPFIEEIKRSSILSQVKLIAEPWDTATYRLGHFTYLHNDFKEWNDRLRDTVCDFIAGDRTKKSAFASHICGSPTIFRPNGGPLWSINYVTCHDGWSLRDLVSYERPTDDYDPKKNYHSWNCGEEGPSADPWIERLRQKQMRNLHVALLVCQGTPMVRMGDEYGHTQGGRHNSWNVDGPVSWFQWDSLQQNQLFFSFYSAMIHYRKEQPLLRKKEYITDRDIEWHGVTPYSPDWKGDNSIFAFSLKGGDEKVYVAFNQGSFGMNVVLPTPPPQKKWRFVANTGCEPGSDFYREPNQRPHLIYDHLFLGPHSCVLIESCP